MNRKPSYESGARKLKEKSGHDAKDDFSQDAAANKKPPNGMGLSEKSGLERSEADKSDLRSKPA